MIKDELNFPKAYLIDTSTLIGGLLEGNKQAKAVLEGPGPLYFIQFLPIETTNVLRNKGVSLEKLQQLQLSY